MTRRLQRNDTAHGMYIIENENKSVDCYGWVNVMNALRRYEAYLGMHYPKCEANLGTKEVWDAYEVAIKAMRAEYEKTHRQIMVDCNPQLRFLIGRVVRVTTERGEVHRWLVGRSCGWLPVLLSMNPKGAHLGGDPIDPAMKFLNVEVERA